MWEPRRLTTLWGPHGLLRGQFYLFLVYSSTLKTGVVRSFEISVNAYLLHGGTSQNTVLFIDTAEITSSLAYDDYFFRACHLTYGAYDN
jgi:hypothetical protein